jgi:RHS repeat-associated protein
MVKHNEMAMQTLSDLPTNMPVARVEFDYDYMSRLVGKTVYEWGSNDWQEVSSAVFLYDAWNLISEQTSAETNFLTFGLDLSGTLQGAGGIGGLVSAVLGTNAACYTYDANGNVSEVLNIGAETPSSRILAHYEYSPFGETIVATGELAKDNPFRFSSKYTDDETSLVYYGYRYYSPSLGRWISLDPASEKGGLNLYGFVWNSPMRIYDPLGLAPQICGIDENGMPIYCDDPDPCWGHCPPPPPDGNWYDDLPDCPCSIPLGDNGCPDSSGAGQDWTAPKRTGHEGGTWEIRSGGQGLLAPGQQCVYDSAGKLINQGPAAGTPDRVSPDNLVDKVAHIICDCWQYKVFGNEYDHQTHPPNQGRDGAGNPCPLNDGSSAPPPENNCCD